MKNSANNRPLDKLELELSPKQWAIKLVHEMRQYPSQKDFFKGIATGSCQQSPFTRPFYALAEQASKRSSKGKPESISEENKLNRKLRSEFKALKSLVSNVNDKMEIKSRTNREKAAVQLLKLHSLILQDAFSRTGSAEHFSGSSARLYHFSELKDCADCLAALLIETTAYKAAVRIIQDKYFESHAILFNDIEMASDITVGAVRDAIELFNDYRKLRSDISNRKVDKKQQKGRAKDATPCERDSSLRTDINEIEERAGMLAQYLAHKWAGDASLTANAWILREIGKDEDFVWARFRQEVGLEPPTAN
jgi:hypothetical protein